MTTVVTSVLLALGTVVFGLVSLWSGNEHRTCGGCGGGHCGGTGTCDTNGHADE